MGFDKNVIRFLLKSIESGTSLHTCVTLGRQAVGATNAEIKELLERFGYDLRTPEISEVFRSLSTRRLSYAEPLLKALGGKNILSLDHSDYENASIIHDLNQEIPASLRNTCDCVIDGGTLEHVFNVPKALENSMNMLKIGGRFLGINPANNCLNHGFYQFSPDLFWGVFSPRNGFFLEKMYVVELATVPKWYSVQDPRGISTKEEFSNLRPTYLFVRARKTRDLTGPIDTQQGEFHSSWSGTPSSSDSSREPSPLSKIKQRCKMLIPRAVKIFFHTLRRKIRHPLPSPFFIPEDF